VEPGRIEMPNLGYRSGTRRGFPVARRHSQDSHGMSLVMESLGSRSSPISRGGDGGQGG